MTDRNMDIFTLAAQRDCTRLIRFLHSAAPITRAHRQRLADLINDKLNKKKPGPKKGNASPRVQAIRSAASYARHEIKMWGYANGKDRVPPAVTTRFCKKAIKEKRLLENFPRESEASFIEAIKLAMKNPYRRRSYLPVALIEK